MCPVHPRCSRPCNGALDGGKLSPLHFHLNKLIMKPIIVISIPSKNNGIGGIPNNITQAGVSPLVITTWTSLFFRLPTRCLSASLNISGLFF
jgi:hypothetical protein